MSGTGNVQFSIPVRVTGSCFGGSLFVHTTTENCGRVMFLSLICSSIIAQSPAFIGLSPCCFTGIESTPSIVQWRTSSIYSCCLFVWFSFTDGRLRL